MDGKSTMNQPIDKGIGTARPSRMLAWCAPLLAWALSSGATPLTPLPQRAPHFAALAYEAPLDVPRIELHELPHALYRRDLGEDNRKALFIEVLLPLVLLENEQVAQQRDYLSELVSVLDRGESLSAADRLWLRALAAKYRVAGDPSESPSARRALRARVDIVPVDLALAQAATETGWGWSRAARVEHDLFGMKVGPAQAPKRRGAGNRRREHAPKFSDLRQAVHAYVLTLNTHGAYTRFRQLRAGLRSRNEPLAGERLANGLQKYSTQGRGYVRIIQSAIRRHDLERYDLATLHPFTADELAALKQRS
jgi:Bax protein